MIQKIILTTVCWSLIVSICYAVVKIEDGLYEELYDSGVVRRVLTFKDNIQSGPFNVFSEQGVLIGEGYYLNGQLEGIARMYYDNKNPKAEDFKALHKILAPQSKRKHDFVDYSELKSDVKKAAEIGIDSKWYEKWGTNIPNIIT